MNISVCRALLRSMNGQQISMWIFNDKITLSKEKYFYFIFENWIFSYILIQSSPAKGDWYGLKMITTTQSS